MDYHKINKTVMDGTQELCDKVAAEKYRGRKICCLDFGLVNICKAHKEIRF